ncbi:MAG: nucleoside hydrolase [Anaerolineales bacterium]|nr:nucleoside hydrolase [Anaerolineales bacterium]MCB8962567.1 nucleoside hydrolase [Ardenticatenales bacterium]
MTRKMIIDTDTASDDAVAIMMALMEPDIEVVAMTIVAGNVNVKQASINARYTAELCGKEVPVYEGAAYPLMREYYSAEFFHGPDGMGEMYYPDPKRPAEKEHAVSALIRYIEENPGIILVTLGPMTNVALAVVQAPHIVKNVSRCVVMGGAANTVGNITPAAEYNIWVDPEAASICFRSGLPIEMAGWEVCRGAANIVEEEMRYYKEVIDTPLSHFTIDCNASALKTNQEWLGDPGIGLPDPIGMAIAIDPSIVTRKSKHFVEIETEGTFTRGMTVVDQLNVAVHDTDNVSMWKPVNEDGSPHITVCWEINVAQWKEMLERYVRMTVD